MTETGITTSGDVQVNWDNQTYQRITGFNNWNSLKGDWFADFGFEGIGNLGAGTQDQARTAAWKNLMQRLQHVPRGLLVLSINLARPANVALMERVEVFNTNIPVQPEAEIIIETKAQLVTAIQKQTLKISDTGTFEERRTLFATFDQILEELNRNDITLEQAINLFKITIQGATLSKENIEQFADSELQTLQYHTLTPANEITDSQGSIVKKIRHYQLSQLLVEQASQLESSGYAVQPANEISFDDFIAQFNDPIALMSPPNTIINNKPITIFVDGKTSDTNEGVFESEMIDTVSDSEFREQIIEQMEKQKKFFSFLPEAFADTGESQISKFNLDFDYRIIAVIALVVVVIAGAAVFSRGVSSG